MKKINQKIVSLFLSALMIISTFSNLVFADESLRVELSIINFDGNNITHETDFWVNTNIPAAANVKISGAGASIKKPWIILTVPKNGGKVTKPAFIDSQNAYETVRTEDGENWYCIYKFHELAGGNQMTFQFPFKFNVNPTRNLDTETVKLDIVDAQDDTIEFQNMPKLYSTTKTYKALKQEFEYNNSKLHPYGANRYDANTKIYHYNVNTVAGQTTTGPGGRDVEIGFSPIVEIPGDFKGTVSYVVPQNLKVVVHLPEGVVPAKNYENSWVYDPVAKTATYTTTSATPQGPYNHRDYKHGQTYWPHFNFIDKDLDTTYKIKAEYFVDAGLPTERKLPDRETFIQFNGIEFKPGGGFNSYKDNLHGTGTTPITYNIYDGNYAIHEGTIYDRVYDQTDEGLVYEGRYYNENNGSSYDNKRDGLVTKLYSLGDEISKNTNDKRVYYKYFGINSIEKYNSSLTDAEFEAYKQEIIDTINAGNTLYGIKDDGSKEVIKENIKFGELVEINDVAAKYKALDLVFKSPITMDNVMIKTLSKEYPSKEELGKFKDKTYTTRQVYGGRSNAVVSTGFEATANFEAGKEERKDAYSGNRAETSLQPLNATGNIGSSVTTANGSGKNVNLTFEKNGTFAEYYSSGTFTKDYHLWGPLMHEELKDVKLIQLLPPAFNYVSFMGSSYYGGEKIGEPTVVENYKNTGRTAVIYTIPKIVAADYNIDDFGIRTKIEATPYVSRGANTIETFIVYPKNDTIKPRSTNVAYEDALDLDGDGDRDELYLKSTDVINYIPPLELIVKKQVGYTKNDLGLLATGDLGEGFLYNISLFNNTIGPIGAVHVVDKIPYVSDTVVAPNQAGEYPQRGSQFDTPLTSAIEDIPENAAVLERFDVYYQLSGPRDTIDNIRSGNWVTKDQVDDFSKVTSFKLVLKAGKELRTKEEVNFLVNSKIPYDTTLNPGDFAINSAAVSTDGRIFTEGNKVKVTFEKYLVTGKFFKDLDKNGEMDSREDGVANRTVELIDADTGNPVVDAEGNLIKAITDKDGRYSFSVYKRGSYKVRFTKDATEEYTDPFGTKITQNNITEKPEDTDYGLSQTFLLNPLTNTAIVNGGVIATSRNVEILKTSSEADEQGVKKALAGVEFSLMKDGQLVEKKVTNVDGKILFENVPFGDYKIVESKGIEGYEIIEAERDVTVGTASLDIQKFENKPIKRNITLTKIDADEKGTDNKLENVKFGIFGENDLTTPIKEALSNDQGVVTFENIPYGKYKVKEIETIEGYNLSKEVKSVEVSENGDDAISLGEWSNTKIKGNVKITKVDADNNATKLSGVVFALKKDGNEIATATTDENGVAIFENVLYGDYSLVEKTAKEGYLASTETKNVSVRENGKVVDLGNMENTIKKGSITLTKVDKDDNSVKLAGVEFSLKKVEGSVETEVATATTNASGVARFDSVPYGDYVVVEKATLDNYVISTEKKNVSITEDQQVEDLGNFTNALKKGTVTFKKVDADNEEKALAGVRFELRQNGNKKYEAVSDNNGRVSFEDVIYGEYKLVEVGTLNNYNLPASNAFDGVEISIDQDKQVKNLGNISNTIKKGKVLVTKVDAEDANKKLEGVTFVLTQGDKEIYSAKTDENGVATFNGVIYGQYKLKEKATLKNYNLSDEVRDVDIDEEGKVVDLGNFTNTIKKGKVVLTKVDADDTEKTLGGVVFVLEQDGREVYEQTTADDGSLSFEGVVYGKYVLKEKATLQNYNLLAETTQINIDSEGKLIDLGKIKNTLKKGRVLVTKVDAEDANKKLEGVTFVLTQGDKEVYTAKTDENGIASFSGVVYGQYTLKEKATLENYNLSDETREVDIDADGKIVDLGNFENKIIKGSVTLKKVDSEDDSKTLEGVTFVLEQDGKEIYEATSDENGDVRFEDVVFGKYNLKEKATLENYKLSEKETEVSVTTDGLEIDLGNFDNKLIRGAIKISKADEKGNNLKGVEFTLYDKDGMELEKKLTDENGTVTFENLLYGDYKVKETKELKGYYKNDKEYSFEIREDDKTLEEKVVNKKIPVKAPNTGDDRNVGLLLALLGLSIFGTGLSRKKLYK